MNENTALSCHVLSKNSHDKSPFLDFHTMPNKMPSRQPNLIWLHFTMKLNIVKRFPIPALPWWCHSGPQRFSSPRATLGAHDLICSMWVSAMTSRRVFIYMYLFIYLFIYISTCYRDLPVKISATTEAWTITINDCFQKCDITLPIRFREKSMETYFIMISPWTGVWPLNSIKSVLCISIIDIYTCNLTLKMSKL